MHTYKIELNRRAEFPLDMLRYDDAAPATITDEGLIDLMKDISSDRSHLPQTVTITLRTLARAAPHTRRWESFGVRVIESDNPLSEISAPVRAKPSAETRLDGFSIGKRDADAYDIYYTRDIIDTFKSGRVARLRASFTLDDDGLRVATPGSWSILWEGDSLGMVLPEGLTSINFETAQDAFSAFVQKMLG